MEELEENPEIRKILKIKDLRLTQRYPQDLLFGFLMAGFSVEVRLLHSNKAPAVFCGLPSWRLIWGYAGSTHMKSIPGKGIMLGILSQGKQGRLRQWICIMFYIRAS